MRLNILTERYIFNKCYCSNGRKNVNVVMSVIHVLVFMLPPSDLILCEICQLNMKIICDA
jgi:hypothetical protein